MNSDDGGHDASPYAPPQAEAGPRGRTTFSLAALMTLVVLLSICFGIMTYTVGLGIAALIIVSLAFVRVVLRRRTAWHRGWHFDAVWGVGAIILIAVCGSIAFFATCFSSGFGMFELENVLVGFHDEIPITFAFGFGILAALQTTELIAALMLRKRAES